ncbi:MAG: outer membrane protein assembly factor BamA [Gammaproteobacteria bacterium]
MIRILFLILISVFTNLSHADEQQLNFIEIDGNKRITNEEIIEYSNFEIGKIYNQDDISEIIKRLFSTNLFTDISIKTENNTLIINVIETPLVSRINVEGNKLLETEQIISSLESIGIKKSKPYSKNLLDKVEQELVRLYYDNGRYSSSVEIDGIMVENNLINLNVKINEGEASTIKEVKVIGNRSFSTRQIKSIIKSGPKYWFEIWSDKDIYNNTQLDQDIESIIQFYQNMGYAKVRIVSKQVNLSSDKKDIYITISIDEGKKYIFGSVSAMGLENFNDEIIKNTKKFNLKPGTSFNRSKIESAKQSIKFILGEKGYAFPDINYNASFNDSTSSVDIAFLINSNSKSFVRRINIIGNTKTNDEVYRRELRQFESSLYQENKINRSKIRLQRLKYVNNVEVKKTIINQSTGVIDIDFIIDETQSGEFQIGAGYSDSSGAIFNVKLQQDNFLGRGNNVSLELEKSSYKKMIRYSNTNPYHTRDGISKTTNLVFSETDVSSTSTAAYISDTIAYGVNYNVPISETKSYGYGAQLVITEYTTTSGSPSNVRSFLNKHGNTHIGFLFNANYTEDTRDRTVYASSGKRQSIISHLYIPPDFDYSYASVKFMGEYNKPYNLNFLNMFDWNTVLQTKPQIGIGAGLIGSSSLPFHDKFFAGGDRSVRGFDSNSLGPLRNNTTCTAKTCDAIGGDFLFAIQNNWIFPPPPFLGEDNRNFRASLFVDIGNVFEDIADFSYSDLRGSYGIQGNFRTPVGAVSIGFVDTFKSKTGDDTKPIIFSLGGAF